MLRKVANYWSTGVKATQMCTLLWAFILKDFYMFICVCALLRSYPKPLQTSDQLFIILKILEFQNLLLTHWQVFKVDFHLLLQFRNFKIVYRRYAGLYFCFCVDVDDNNLSYLEAIHNFVEVRKHICFPDNMCLISIWG